MAEIYLFDRVAQRRADQLSPTLATVKTAFHRGGSSFPVLPRDAALFKVKLSWFPGCSLYLSVQPQPEPSVLPTNILRQRQLGSQGMSRNCLRRWMSLLWQGPLSSSQRKDDVIKGCSKAFILTQSLFPDTNILPFNDPSVMNAYQLSECILIHSTQICLF